MTIKGHPAPENLFSCAAGSMPEALAAVMACHMSMCSRCRRELSFLDAVGAALLENLPPEPVISAAISPGPERASTSVAASLMGESDVPAPLQKIVGHRLKDVKWRRISPGIWQYPIPLSEHSKASLRLIKVAPGLALPDHGHSGLEMTLVLQGAFADKFGQHEVGDVVELDENVEHAPVAAPGVDCICLIASEGPARFHGFLAGLIQKFKGL